MKRVKFDESDLQKFLFKKIYIKKSIIIVMFISVWLAICES